MNNDGLLVPKKKIIRASGVGFTPAFWTKHWDDTDEPVTERQYNKTKAKIEENISVLTAIKDKKNVYAEVKFRPEAKSMSMRPKKIWEDANIEVIESKDDTTITIGGSSSDFQKLEKILKHTSYELATSEDDDITDKVRDISRELFAVSAIEDRNSDIGSRVDAYVGELIKNRLDGRKIDCLIELRSDIPKVRYEEIYTILDQNTEGDIVKRDPELFFANMSYLANLYAYEIDALLTSLNFNFIKIIKRQPAYIAQRSPSSLDISNITVSAPFTNVVIGIVDSGIDNPLLNRLKLAHPIKRTGLKENKTHGTFVASRAIFGHDLQLLKEGRISVLDPVCRVVDVQVLGEKNIGGRTFFCADNDQDIIGAITDSVKQNEDVKIYNISITEYIAADPDNISELTVTLDKLSREYDVLFIVSAGNHEVHKTESYDSAFTKSKSHDNGIAAPGDSINSLTVGAAAYHVDDSSMATAKHFPSPFSRVGNIRNGVRKPEFVEDGGNYDADDSLDDVVRDKRSREKYGVTGLRSDGLDVDLGTSFSSPLIAHQAAIVQDYVSNNLSSSLVVKNNYSNLIRTIMVHSTAFIDQVAITNKDIQQAHGFGIPNFDALFGGDDNQITIVYCDEIDPTKKVQKLRFEIPKFLASAKSSYVLTLAYNPPVDSNFPNEYNMIKIQPALRSILPAQRNDKGKMVEPNVTISHGKDWRNCRSERGSIWHYTSTNKGGLPSGVLEVHLQIQAHPSLKLTTAKAKLAASQPYALALTIRDKDESGRLRNELLNSNQFNLITRTNIQVS